MKKRITSLMLILVVSVSMTMGASAASYIPDDVTYQNLNGQQLAIKYLGDGRTEIKPCPLVYLMSDGSLEPVVFADHYDIEECASEGGNSFVGFVPMP